MAVGLSYPGRGRHINAKTPQRSLRTIALLSLVTLLMAGCALRLAQLQLINGQHNRDLAEKNRIATVPIPSDRGNIRDRNGKLLATNRISRSVYLTPRDQSPEQWHAIAPRLGTILNMPAAEILTTNSGRRGHAQPLRSGSAAICPPIASLFSPKPFPNCPA